MNQTPHESLQHSGVKGMRWGVRKQPKASSGKVTIKERLGSLKRERQWKKVLVEIDNLSNEEITSVTKRVSLENNLKRLSKQSPAASKKDRQDYIKRADMDDEELSRKVTRLRAKDALTRSISDASKEQREFGEKVVNVGGSLAMKYATTKSLTPKDILESLNDGKKSIKDKAVKELVDSVSGAQRSSK